ncbi:mucin-5AC [Nilaparvata lugens]|uniref:mucin-5AC n=1 Tax=Nilaparvata lugens TaxID=108931 RepID=UPI00193E1845|nr:mucin-5AC [Nilaparvata lugens]
MLRRRIGLLISTVCILLQVVFESASASSVGLGDTCSRDEECLVGNSRCFQGLCQCLPYYAVYNNSQCLQSTLLGFDCLVNEQCSQKVANSSCIGGYCRCEQGFLQFRRHTCLTPAKVGDVCYGDSHCRLWDSGTHCDFLIPKLFGRCICTSPLKLSSAGTCLPPRPLRTPSPTARPRPGGLRPFATATRPFSNHQFSHKNQQQYNLMRKPPLTSNIHYKQNQSSQALFLSQKVPAHNNIIEPTTISYTKPIVTTSKPPNTSIKVTTSSTSTTLKNEGVSSSKHPSLNQPIKYNAENSIIDSIDKQSSNTKNSISYVQDLLVSQSAQVVGVATDPSLISSSTSAVTLKAPVKYSVGNINYLKPAESSKTPSSNQVQQSFFESVDRSPVVPTTQRNVVKTKPPKSTVTARPSSSTSSFRPTKLPFLSTTVSSVSSSSAMRRPATMSPQISSATSSPVTSARPSKFPVASTTHRTLTNLLSKRPIFNKWQGLKRPNLNKIGNTAAIKSNLGAATTSTTTTTSTTAPPVSQTPVSNRWDEAKVVSLGLPCSSDKQCKAADPASRCMRGVCDCANQSVRNSSSVCSATNTGCHAGTFQCTSTGQCISWYFVCDGRRDCADGSDEACQGGGGCPRTAFTCHLSLPPAPICVSAASRCNGVNECPNGEDELECDDKHNKGCPANTFKCGSGECLAAYEFCNAVISCRDGSDEGPACSATGGVHQSQWCPFRCANGRCRSTAVTCSGRDGCGDNSDETSCTVCKCPSL